MRVSIVTKTCDGFTRDLFAFETSYSAREFIDVQGDRYDIGVDYHVVVFEVYDTLPHNFYPSVDNPETCG